tara:strand:- start:451 stop:993 length:543 start_codon:yes stop_codon:yes gene_type:complete
MSLEKVLSISGKPGLYKMTKQTRGGFLAESLLDQKKISVSSRHNVSLLTEIAIYTLTKEVPLREIFQKIAAKEAGSETISHKVPKLELEEFFFGILPDYDEERVYPSDIKKVVQWYNLLVKNGFTDFSEAKQETKVAEDQTKTEVEVEEKAPKAIKKTVKKVPAKKAAAAPKKKATTAKK